MLYSRDKLRLVNIVLAVFCAAVALWALSLWIRPIASPSLSAEEAQSRAAVQEAVKIELKRAVAYDDIESKDLFRSSRRKYEAPPPPKPVRVAAPAPPPPPPPPPPPRLTLVGTLFLDDGWAALVVYGGSEASYYKVGDILQDFTIKEINKNYIVINRGAELVRYDMDKTGVAGAPALR